MKGLNIHINSGPKTTFSSSDETKIEELVLAQSTLEEVETDLMIYFAEKKYFEFVGPAISQLVEARKMLAGVQQQIKQAAGCDDKH